MSNQFDTIQTQQEYHDEKMDEFIQSRGEMPPPTPLLKRAILEVDDNNVINDNSSMFVVLHGPNG